MNKLFGLFLLAIACWAPDVAQAAARFAVCTTTCTWDNSSTAMWSTTSGGATGASAPTSADDVTLDANTCVGGTTCTITTFSGTISVSTLTMSACTASTSGCILAANTNNTNFIISGSSGYVNNGAGTRTLNMGTGTWTFSAASTRWLTNASATYSAASSTIVFTGTTGNTFTGGGKTYGTLSFPAISNSGSASQNVINDANTFATLTIAAPNRISLQGNVTQTVTTMTNVTGSSSQQVLIAGSIGNNQQGTLSSANNWTCTWCAISMMVFTGGGTFTGTNSFDLLGNSGITITAPSGGGGGGRIIGG